MFQPQAAMQQFWGSAMLTQPRRRRAGTANNLAMAFSFQLSSFSAGIFLSQRFYMRLETTWRSCYLALISLLSLQT